MRSVGLVLLVTLLAGCADPVPDASTEDSDPPPLPEPVRLTIPMADCHANVVFFFADFETVEPFLPAGFYPRDAVDLLDLGPTRDQATTGRAGVVTTVDACIENDVQEEPVRFMDTAILVEPPHVEADQAPSSFDGYLLERRTTAGPFHDLMVDMGLPSGVATEVEVQAQAAGPADHITSQIRDSGGQYFRMEGATAVEQSFNHGIVRFWHVDTNGTTYMDQNLTLSVRVGQGECSYRPDSPLDAMFGQGACDPSQTVFARFPAFDLPTEITRLPEVFPQ